MADSTPDAIHAAFKNAPDIREHWEREAFEAWGAEMMRWGGAGDDEVAAKFMRHRAGPLFGEYVDTEAEARWQAWKARAALNPPPADAKRVLVVGGDKPTMGELIDAASADAKPDASPDDGPDQGDYMSHPGVVFHDDAKPQPAQDAPTVDEVFTGMVYAGIIDTDISTEQEHLAQQFLEALATQPAQDDLRACANVLDDAAESLRKLMNGGGSQVRAVEFWAKRLRSIATQPAQEQEQEQGRTDTERMDWLEQEAPDIDRDALGNAVVTFSTTEDGTGLDTVEECTLREAVDAAMLAAEREAGGSA